MNITILDAYTANPGDLSWQALESLGSLNVYDRTPSDEVIDRAKDAPIVLSNKVPFDRSRFEQLPNLQLISILATGHNIIDLDAARDHGVTVCNVPSYSTDSVAQHVFALILHLTNQVAVHDASVHAGDWQRCEDFMYTQTPLTELAGKTLGIFGYGEIGRRVGEVGHALGMNILAHNRSRSNAPDHANFAWAEVDQLFAESDIITLHAPQTPQTKNMVNADLLATMKPSAMLINTARGGLIVEADLAAALRERRIAAAAVDVARQEPINADNPLLTAPNLVITPHIAWATREARQRLIQITADNIKHFLEDQPINVVS